MAPRVCGEACKTLGVRKWNDMKPLGVVMTFSGFCMRKHIRGFYHLSVTWVLDK